MKQRKGISLNQLQQHRNLFALSFSGARHNRLDPTKAFKSAARTVKFTTAEKIGVSTAVGLLLK